MIKTRHFSFAILAGAALLVSSCSNQMYSYRQKVNVDHSVAQTKKAEPIKEIEAKAPKSIVLPVQPAPATQLATAPVITPEMQPILKDIQQVVPQNSSKANFSFAKQGVKSVKNQIKAVKKDISKAQSSLDIDGKRWMIIGAIVWLIGVVLGFALGNLGWALVAVGGLIFLIGLIFFLLGIL